MKIIDWNKFISDSFYISEPCGITIGTFDGLHKGHIFLIKQLFSEECKEKIVFTFRQNPSWFFKKDYPGDINTLEQKLNALEMTGVTTTILIDFSSDFSKLSGNYFISCILNHLNLVRVVVGEDFKFGKDNDTTARDLADNYFDSRIALKIVKRQSFGNTVASSSLIRSLVKTGKIEEAEKLLDFGYAVNLNNIDVYHDREYSYVYKKDIFQVLPENGRYELNIIDGKTTLRKEVTIDDTFFKWL